MSKDPPNKPTSWRKVHRVLSWSAASPEKLHDLVVRLTDSGCAVMFSTTIDASALVLSVYSGQDKDKEYVTEVGDIPPLFEWMVQTYS